MALLGLLGLFLMPWEPAAAAEAVLSRSVPTLFHIQVNISLHNGHLMVRLAYNPHAACTAGHMSRSEHPKQTCGLQQYRHVLLNMALMIPAACW